MGEWTNYFPLPVAWTLLKHEQHWNNQSLETSDIGKSCSDVNLLISHSGRAGCSSAARSAWESRWGSITCSGLFMKVSSSPGLLTRALTDWSSVNSVHLFRWWSYSRGNNRQVSVQKSLQFPGSGHPPFIVSEDLSQAISDFVWWPSPSISHLPYSQGSKKFPRRFGSIPPPFSTSAEWDVLCGQCLPDPIPLTLSFPTG